MVRWTVTVTQTYEMVIECQSRALIERYVAPDDLEGYPDDSIMTVHESWGEQPTVDVVLDSQGRQWNPEDYRQNQEAQMVVKTFTGETCPECGQEDAFHPHVGRWGCAQLACESCGYIPDEWDARESLDRAAREKAIFDRNLSLNLEDTRAR